ncbi:MAG: hypothetical protein AMJ95_04915 [Omnitrophica WOR_2 bacterium SM23_72]|nr:MAG: hypothetical protein AMJ95_04915 [Omnitrophica WOR_2 bacterium SM23_72]
MIKFTEIISASVEWTTTLLFRPFNPKKWLILTFIALMAGSISGFGGNYLAGDTGRQEGVEVAQAIELVDALQEDSPGDSLSAALESLNKPSTVTLFMVIIPLLLGLFLVIMWLSSRFAFIFLESVVENDASIRVPFRENKILGNSLFKFSLVASAAFLSFSGIMIVGYFFTLSKMGVLRKSMETVIGKVILVSVPFALAFLSLLLIAILIYLIVHDFVLVAMFKDKIKISQALPRIIALMKAQPVLMVKYVLIKAGLGICSAVISYIVSFIAIIGLILPVGLVIGIFYMLYRLLPAVLHLPYTILMYALGLPVAAFLLYAMLCLYLPFAVFFRTFSLKFLGQVDPQYNLFCYAPKTEVVS